MQVPPMSEAQAEAIEARMLERAELETLMEELPFGAVDHSEHRNGFPVYTSTGKLKENHVRACNTDGRVPKYGNGSEHGLED